MSLLRYQPRNIPATKNYDAVGLIRPTRYVHINLVKHGLVTRVVDHRMVKQGVYPEDWAGDVADHGDAFGER